MVVNKNKKLNVCLTTQIKRKRRIQEKKFSKEKSCQP